MVRKSAGSSALDEELKRLYTLPLGEFVAARNALAKKLAKEGDREAAEEVKALAKASVSAWAVTQLFAREGGRMEALLAAGEKARAALQHTLTVGDAESLRAALQEQRGLRDDLRRRAAGILTAELRAPGQAILDRVGTNLDALALSPGAAAEAARGWLADDLEPPGFEVLSGLQFAAPRTDRHGLRLVPAPATAKKPEDTKPSGKKPAAAEKRRQAEEEAREREEERRRARIERAQEKADRLAADADSARRAAEKAERDAAEAEKAAQEAVRRAELARGDAGRVRLRADRAAEEAERAAKDLEAARRP
jgi:hypothetical protein